MTKGDIAADGAASLGREEVKAAAEALDKAERDRSQIGLLSEAHPGLTMADAYAIQAEWVQSKLARKDKVTGWKIGLTSKAMQSALSIDIPDSGVLLQSMMFANGAGIPQRFIQPRVEAEIAFVLKEDLEGNPSAAEILDKTDHVLPALEILDTRIVRRNLENGRLRNVCDTIADNAANGGVVLGEPVHDFRSLDLRWIGAILTRNDEVEETGLGAGVLGDPCESVAWLARRLSAFGGRIEAGQVILSGSFIRPVEAPAGSHIVGDFGAFGRVECRFE